MHKKYARDGLVAMNVSLDNPTDKKLMSNVRAFLTEQKVDFASFVLNEEPDFWQEKLGFAGPPAVFVFGKDGKLAKRYAEADEPDYKAIEKVVQELLKK
jgi:hypothetical protein